MEKTYKGNNFTAVFTDENGYFSLTGDIDGGSGAIGDKLAKIDPRFTLLNDMHLSDCETGAPMHSWENAFYFIKGNDDAALDRHIRHKSEEFKNAYLAIHDAKNLERDVSGYNARVTKPTIERLENLKVEIAALWDLDAEAAYTLAESIPADLTDIDETVTLDDYNEPDKAQALAQHLDCHFSEVTEDDDIRFSAEGMDFLIVTDDEAEILWDESLDSYLDDCVLPDIPDNMQNYFDTEAWKRDAKMDGRGHSLSSYNGCEYNQEVDGETYYIFRQ